VKAAFQGTGVKVLTCDDTFTVAQDQVCEHRAVADHVAAVISGSSTLAADESILTHAGIPVIGSTDATSPVSFAVSQSEGDYVGIGVGLYQAGCRRLGLLYLDGTDVLAAAIQQGGKWQSVTKAAIPINAPDLTPAITKLGEGKVDCIAISTFPTTVIQAMTAIKQDALNVKVAMTAAILNPQVLKSLGSSANGLIVAEAGVLNPVDTAPVVAQINSQMKAIDSSATLSDLGIVGWASAKLILDAAPSISGPVTAASMLAAMNGLRNASTDGAMPPFSAVPLANKAYTRYFNHYDITYSVQNGSLVRMGNFYDLSPAIDG
jgi:Periplasmic binding protein